MNTSIILLTWVVLFCFSIHRISSEFVIYLSGQRICRHCCCCLSVFVCMRNSFLFLLFWMMIWLIKNEKEMNIINYKIYWIEGLPWQPSLSLSLALVSSSRRCGNILMHRFVQPCIAHHCQSIKMSTASPSVSFYISHCVHCSPYLDQSMKKMRSVCMNGHVLYSLQSKI